MEMTTLPLSGSRNDRTVTTALSQGVATTTTSAPAAPALSDPDHRQVPVGPAGLELPHDARGPLRVTRADRHLEARVGEPGREPAPGRARAAENAHVHASTFA